MDATGIGLLILAAAIGLAALFFGAKKLRENAKPMAETMGAWPVWMKGGRTRAEIEQVKEELELKDLKTQLARLEAAAGDTTATPAPAAGPSR